MNFYATIMHSLVENYGDCGMDEEIEAVKREWWNHGKPHGLKKWNASLIKTSIYFL